MMQRSALFVLFLLAPVLAQAWWNPDWAYRKSIGVDTSPAGGNIPVEVDHVPVLVRLHTGNFGYFLDLADDARDLRFLSGDDQLPLKFHVEKFDPLNEMALVWVQVPKLLAASADNNIWMYYGNPNAISGEDPAGTYDADQTLVYHFATGQAAPRDSSAYANHAAAWTGETLSDALIGAGARFNGNSQLRIADQPALQIDPAKGWTMSFWLRTDALPEAPLPVFSRADENGELGLYLGPNGLIARVQVEEQPAETAPAGFVPGSWHHVALVVTADALQLYLDAQPVQRLAATLPLQSGDILLGAPAADMPGFSGDLDEVQLSSVARDAAWLTAQVKSQAPGSSLVVYGEDADQDSGGGSESYFMITLHNVTLDGWVVIVVLAIMAAISWLVMVNKGLVINRVRKDNRAFDEQFAQLGGWQIEELDGETGAEERELEESPLMLALAGRHDHFQSSTLYRIYHAGVQEIHHRMARSVGSAAASRVLSPQAINAIKATMDSVLTRESQKLNGQMVLLTIAISGGPFLGLLGTVVGVMITFAVIAATGDVNVNAIAPGIAAALVATVAGLAVAIPALFGYNYLGTRIKDIQSDMHVFADEFIAKIAEEYS